jgi:GNAT superfamily N-acetyltransferase
VPGVEVRPVTLDDFDAVTRLIAEMGPHRSPVPDRMDAVERAFREIVGRPGQVSLVAVSDRTTVGICTVELRESLRLPQPVAWIPELVVTEPFRGRGIGRALLTAALAAAADRGAGSAMLESGAARTTAHALYRSIGFERAGSVHTLLRDR